MAQAKTIALRTQDLAKAAKELRNEENAQGRNRKWRARTKELGKQLVQLEDDEKELEKQFPQACSVWSCQPCSLCPQLVYHILHAAAG